MTIALIAAGAVCTLYGVAIMLASSGTTFFMVWYALGAVLGGTGALALALPGAGWVRALRAVVAAAALAGMLAVCLMSARIMGEAHREPPGDLDYLIVLGAQVRADGTPANALRYRLEAACAYLEEHPATQAVVTGGQGPNEPETEASAMARWLADHDISRDRIVIEDASTTTAENLANARGLIGPGQRVGVVTNDFHLYRAVRIARKQDFAEVWGIAAYSVPGYLPNNLLRECLGIVKNTLTGAM